MSVLLKNCHEIVYSEHGEPIFGKALSVVNTLSNQDIFVEDGIIKKVGINLKAPSDVQVIDCSGKTVVPGFVDSHTHPVFDGDRSNEFALKLAGAGYMEIHAAGGGIHYTVKKTKEAEEDVLLQKLLDRLDQMVQHGTLTVEAKSGYGLELDTEIKMLKVIKRAQNLHKMTIQSTYLCAHAVPRDSNATEMTEKIISEHIETVAKLDLNVTNIDVFCEAGVYDAEQTRRICQAGQRHGWNANVHVEEIEYIGGAEACTQLGARALSHLEMVSDTAIKMMSEKRTAAVILPTTAYILKLTPPPVRKLIDANCIVALGSDFNPNAPCFSMPTVMHLACLLCGMSMEEAFHAATINSAYSLGLDPVSGSITVGKQANMLVIDAPNWKHIIYQLGNHQNLIREKIIHGVIVT